QTEPALSVSGALAWFADLTVAAQVHNVFKVILLALVALHVLAIPFHRIVLKNNVMVRMLRPAN
ncbi:MAG TPA: cytochrome B, partial [Rhizobium sp.]|nr:cytochrome B [Rhizobium sp.]